jgi:hypothetical protein
MSHPAVAVVIPPAVVVVILRGIHPECTHPECTHPVAVTHPVVEEDIRPHGVLVEELVVVCRVTWLTIQSILRTYLTSHQPEQCRV